MEPPLAPPPPPPHDCRIASTPLSETPSARARTINSRRPIFPCSKSCIKSSVVLMDASLLHSCGLPALRMRIVCHLSESTDMCQGTQKRREKIREASVFRYNFLHRSDDGKS